MQPIAGPCDSPKVVTLKSTPMVFPNIAIFPMVNLPQIWEFVNMGRMRNTIVGSKNNHVN
jgi:hypothetical protein